MNCPKVDCHNELVICIYGDNWFYHCPTHGNSQDFSFPPQKRKQAFENITEPEIYKLNSSLF